MIPHLFHVVQGGVYHKQSRPHVNPYIYDDIKTIRDHTHLSAHGGARFYLADVFPEEYRNRLFMCNIHEHAVLTDVMVPRGSSFVGQHGDDFLPANDMAWVGFSVEIGPEGGVYLLDWHDQDICGNAVEFPNSGRVYRVMPKSTSPMTRPNLRAMSDLELVSLMGHSNDWYVRHARTLLQYRSSSGKLDRDSVHNSLNKMLSSEDTSAKRLRALWALFVTDGLSENRLLKLLDHNDQYVRAWAIQMICDSSDVNAFQQNTLARSIPDDSTLKKFESLARSDPSPVVRLYLASAVQRLPFDVRWPILAGLVSHPEDIDDNNLPRMYWFGLEPMVPDFPRKSLELVVNGKIPALQEFVARRIATGDTPPAVLEQNIKRARWNQTIDRVAKGFQVQDVGEGGVAFHKLFRNTSAVRTHPLDKNTPCVLQRSIQLDGDKKSTLKMRVSHHPHGDWQLRVLVNGLLLREQIVSSKTVGRDEWLDISVDLSEYSGKLIRLSIENRANDWHNEWAYWQDVSIISEDLPRKESKADKAKVVFVSGKPSHGRMKHEHRAGNLLLAESLNRSGIGVEAVLVPHYGYPTDKSIFQDAATVVIFSTGHAGHVLNQHLVEFDQLMKAGTGVVMIHWATEAEKGEPGKKFLQWMGGFCDLDWSVNPHWAPKFSDFPNHPICRGLKPFSVDDEWYYHMRFVDKMQGVTPILFDLPPPHTLRRPDGPRSGNPHVRKAVANGEKQVVAWAYERPTGGRGFGFTGAHNHVSWQDENFRKVVLNAILWTANLDVPQNGCPMIPIDDSKIEKNLDNQN